MAIKIPVRGDYDVDGNVTGLAEFQSGDSISVLHGGTGIDILNPASVLIGSTVNQMTQVLLAANQLLIGSHDGSTIVATSTINCGKMGD